MLIAVDLAADGIFELELELHGARELESSYDHEVSFFKIWAQDGGQRRLRETGLQWHYRQAIRQFSCGRR